MTAPASRPIFLTGFMATGKSRVGRALALRLGRPFYDTDDMIETRAGKPIPRIFTEDGEEAFRALETACVREAAARPDAVVALGGGAITRADNRDAIRQAGALLVCVEADVDTILERVSRRDDRPLLAGLSPEQKRQRITEMLAERAPFYATADITLRSGADTDADDLARELAERLREGTA